MIVSGRVVAIWMKWRKPPACVCIRNRDDCATFVHNFVTDVIQRSFLRLVDDFLIGRLLSSRVPVDHAAAAIDQSVVVKADEHFEHGSRVFFIEGVALSDQSAETPEPVLADR